MNITMTIRAEDNIRDAVSDIKDALSNAMDDIALDGMEIAKFNVDAQTLGTGRPWNLSKSINVDLSKKYEKYLWSGGEQVPYDVYVEFGTAPHWPPMKALEPWVRHNLAYKDVYAGAKKSRTYMIGAPRGQGWRKVKAKGKTEQQEVARVTFLVCRHIARHGTPPKPFMRPALAAMERDAPGIIAREMEPALSSAGKMRATKGTFESVSQSPTEA